MKRAREVDRDNRVPLVDREFLDRVDVLNAGVVHQDVDPAEFSISSGSAILALEYMTPTLCCRLRSLTILSIASAGPKPLSTILVPDPASAVAMPSPIPLVEPVTMAVLPARISFPLKPTQISSD